MSVFLETIGVLVTAAFFILGVFTAVALVLVAISEDDSKIPLSQGCYEREFIKRNADLCKMYFLSEGKAK